MVVKENFCGACLTIPLAFAGAGTAIGAEKKAQLQKWAIIFTVVSIVLTIYFVYIKKCRECRIK
ncbi:hypothetical protein WIV_gp067 [Wiseana iridescent virus]|uniref:Uncharacterized protein n=1 Tax=Wiseana iridescent virus TaxID=68347 RepID=G0T593_IRV9|nr:hypothetical protein WIV_gp067 [Wiseana iridescent virus]ADO00410.1 hypothetical protein [Wiseana iridescent virus]